MIKSVLDNSFQDKINNLLSPNWTGSESLKRKKKLEVE